MAINYPGTGYLRGYEPKDPYEQFAKGYGLTKGIKDEAEAPDAFAAGLTADPLLPPAEQMRAMFANPNTREQAIGLAQAAQERRAQAADPLRQLQLRKAQIDVAQAGRGPSPTAEQRNFALASKDPKFAEFIGRSGAVKAPADVQEYLWFREEERAAGREPMPYLDFLKAQKGDGLSVQTNPDGTVSVTQGGNGMPKLTEGQSKDAVYVTRGSGALPILDELGNNLTSLGESVAGNVPFGQYLQSDEYQQADQAGREFLSAVLRKDTGAAITDQEMSIYGKTYLPQPGDKPGMLEQKKGARSRALKAIGLGLPTAAVVGLEEAGVTIPGLSDGAADADEAGPPAGWSGDASLWKFLTPEERALWN